MINSLLAALVFALVAVKPASTSELAGISLIEAVRDADRIVHGELVRVITLPHDGRSRWSTEEDDEERFFAQGVRIAEVLVDRTLKGATEPRTALFLAQATWTCDATDGEVGERGYFLITLDPQIDALRARTGGTFEATFGGRPLMAIVGSGQGKFTEQRDEDRALVYPGVELPAELPRVRNNQRDMVAPADLERSIAMIIEAQRKPLLTIQLIGSAHADAPWRLDLARDGITRIASVVSDSRDPDRAKTAAAQEFKIYWLRSLARALMIDPLPTEGAEIVLRGSTPALFELTLHTKDGPRMFTLRIDPIAGAPDERGARMELIWRAVQSTLEDTPLAADARRALSLREKRSR